jgi:hypothetical protein
MEYSYVKSVERKVVKDNSIAAALLNHASALS